MSEKEQLEQAISALEAQRGLLGDSVVDTALAPLKEKLASLRVEAVEQRKVLTVLFADLVGFTAMAEKMDPEDVREILNSYFTRWTALIEEQGGLVEKFIGDAVVAVFGLPAAHENDPERAVRTGFAMRRALQKLNEDLQRTLKIQLSMRVGIHTGPVVASTEGGWRTESFTVIGDTVNLASRLQSIAPTNGILISHDTYRHVRGLFDFQPLDPVSIKGKSETVRSYVVLREKPRTFQVFTAGVEGVETRMVGREVEFRQLQDAFWEMIRERSSRIVTILGEPGIGKSRMIYEFDEWLDLVQEEVFYFRGRAHPSTLSLPYSLIRDLFAFRFQIQDSDDPQTVRGKLERGIMTGMRVQTAGQDGDRQALADEAILQRAHYIGALLGFTFGESPYLAGARTDARQFHDRTLVYLGDYFRSLASLHPIVVMLEDLHWADDSSLDLITRFHGNLGKLPLLIVGSARPSLWDRRPGWGESLPFHKLLELQPLSTESSSQLVEEILQRVSALPERLRDVLVQSADGNPFYLEELIKMLMEDGVIVKGQNSWEVAAERLEELRVPPTLTGVLQSRIDSLEAGERLTLQRASVLGRVFWDKAVLHLGQQDTRPEPASPELLDNLANREMVMPQKDSTFENTREYMFRHALLRDVTYENLLRRQRRMYHARAARWLETVTERGQRAGEFATLIAGHYEAAGETVQAATWYRRAGERAAQQYANAEAIFHLSRALDLWPAEDLRGRYELLRAREGVYDWLASRQEQLQDLEALVDLAEKIDDDELRTAVELRRANYYFFMSAYSEGIEAARRALELAKSIGSTEQEIRAQLFWGKLVGWQGAADESIALLEQALAYSRQAGMRSLEAESLWNLSIINSNRGAYAQATSQLEQALAIFREIGDRSGESVVMGQLGVVYLSQRDYARARKTFEEVLPIYRAMGNRLREAIIAANLGVIFYEQGYYGEARRSHTMSLQLYLDISDPYGISSAYGNLGDVARDVGSFEEAEENYQKSIQLARELGERALEALIMANFSFLYVLKGDYDRALEFGRQAHEIASTVDYAPYEAYAVSRLAYSLYAVGELDEASRMFQKACEIQKSVGFTSSAMESLAGLARIAMQKGDLGQAQVHIEEILEHLKTRELDGVDQPVQVYLTCYTVLEALNDPRAKEVLDRAYDLLQTLAARIEDERLKVLFLEEVPANRTLRSIIEKVRS
jgi:class 3 adenylate cyclase/tetratricopeptide (TPR) repeat protein